MNTVGHDILFYIITDEKLQGATHTRTHTCTHTMHACTHAHTQIDSSFCLDIVNMVTFAYSSFCILSIMLQFYGAY